MKHLLTIILFTIGITACENSETVHIPLENEQWLVKEYPDKTDTTTYLRRFYFDSQNERLGTEGHIEKGKKDGLWKWWYPTGQLKCETYYDHGIPIKVGHHYYETGSLKLIQNYSNRGSDTAFYEYYHPNGELWVKGYWKWNGENDIEEGLHKEWYSNGTLQIIGEYDNNLETGTWIWYDTGGTETKRAIFEKGKEIKTFANNK